MAYLKPSWFNRTIFNKIATTFSFGPFETMIVTKRVSKQPQKIPVTPIDVDGVKYLVAAYGETQWVKNVRANPNAALLIDHYLEDWRRLWYVVLRGKARIVDAGVEQRRAIGALRKKYPQYRTNVPLRSDALVIALDVRRLRHWQASHPVRRGEAPRRQA